ncbi:MAG: STAS domain-containing protein [Chloroflexi bacterium]|nr:STAS domain-containing protein [Chloroflexota bacterium]
MELTITEHIVRINIIAPQGRIDAFCAPELRKQFEVLLGKNEIKFILDLSAVTFLDSAGMAALVSLLKAAREAGGDVKLVWPKEEAAQRILRLTRFDRVFDIADNQKAALSSF